MNLIWLKETSSHSPNLFTNIFHDWILELVSNYLKDFLVPNTYFKPKVWEKLIRFLIKLTSRHIPMICSWVKQDLTQEYLILKSLIVVHKFKLRFLKQIKNLELQEFPYHSSLMFQLKRLIGIL